MSIFRNKREDKLLQTVASLADAVAKQSRHLDELAERLEVLEAFVPEYQAVIEEEATAEQRFQEGINSILSFDLKGGGESEKKRQ
jgi:hypothetical protein